MNKRELMLFFTICALFLFLPVVSAQVQPPSITLNGMGSKTLGPFNVTEGALSIHIGTYTDCHICYFGLSILEDNNLDGEYSTHNGDDYMDSVWSAGYTDIQGADLWVNHSVSASRIKVAVDTGSSVGWDLMIEQHPQPSHEIEVGVWDEKTESPVFDATVTLIDEQGNKYSTGDNSLYGHYHYYFNRFFYGYQNYTVIVSAPGYGSQTLKITSEDFTALGFPGWAVYKKAYLRPSSNEAVIYCKVREKESKTPVKEATVTLQDLTGRGVSTVATDSDGLCRIEGLSEGTYVLTAFAKGFKEQSKQGEALSSKTVEQVIFDLERSAPGIYGTVTDSELGKPVVNITVELTNYGGDEILNKTKTDARGFYTFPELKPENYGVDVSNNILSNQPDERFYEPSGRIIRLKGNEYKRADFVLKPKGVDITAGFDVVPGNRQRVVVGNNYTVDVVVSNNGPKEAADVKLEVKLKEGTGSAEFVNATSTDGSCGSMSEDLVSCSFGNIEKNGVKSVRLILKTMKRGNFTLNTFGAESPIKDWEKKDWLPTNNRDKITVEIKPHKVYGRVAVPYINYNAKLNSSNILAFGLSALKVVSLKNVLVNLTYGSHSYVVYTDEKGAYSFDINSTDSDKFRLQVVLRDRPVTNGKSTIVVRSVKGFNSEPVILKTKEIDVNGTKTKLDLIFTANYAYLDNLSNDQKAVLQDAAVFYYNTYDAVLFTKNKLKLNMDYKLPVDVYIYRPGCGACYDHSDSYIQTDNTVADSAFTSPDTPDNREYHEFGHHVHTDSRMSGENKLSDLRKNVSYKIGAINLLHDDSNHGATRNTDSSDSIVEGFAEFFSSLVQNDPFYRWGGLVTDLSGTNYHTAGGNPDEEFNVASLLWDFYDNDSEKDDYFALGEEDTWKILNSPNIKTVRSLYKSFNATYGKQDTNKTDGLSDVDALFVLHRFYYDANRDGIRDANESIGYGNTGPTHPWVHYPRNDKPRIPGTGLKFSVSDSSGNSVEADAFIVNVHFPDSEKDFVYLTWSNPDDGYLWILVPDNSLSVELTPVAPGYTGKPFVQKPEEFWNAVKEAQQNNQSVYATHEFNVTGNGVPMPEGLRADRINETGVRLLWNPQGSFILVRGIDHKPAYTGDGEILYEGSGTEFVDGGLLTGITYYYTLFNVENGELSKGVSVSFETEIEQPDEQTTTTTKPGKIQPSSERSTGNFWYLLLLILIIAAATIILYLKRREA